MIRAITGCFLLFLFISCGSKKASFTGDIPVKPVDFFNAFQKLQLPYIISDTNIAKKGDSLMINKKVFEQFVPDSVVNKFTGKKNDDLIINPVGKIEKADYKYLLAKFIQQKKVVLIGFLFNKKYQFIAALELLNNKANDRYLHSISINNEPTFLVVREKTTSDNRYLYTKIGYAFNENARQFTVVLNDSNEDTAKLSQIINPIDTLPKKNKFSGDYVQNKKNFISLRDGKNNSVYNFFIHFEKEDECIGELKGEMMMIANNKAVFRESGDPCVIDFEFAGKSILVKEEGSCGNHRGIKCYFDDTYKKKNESKKLNN